MIGECSWNERCNLFLGLPAENALSLSVFLKAVHPEDRDRVTLLIQSRLPAQELIECDYRVIRPDNSVHWLMDIGETYSDPSGTPLHTNGISMDITRKKLFEEKLKENAALGELNRQLQDFAFTASPDLQAPLRTIKGFGRLLLDHYAKLLDEEGKDYIDRMYKATVRMDEMLKGVLNYSQGDNREGEEFKPVNLDQVIQDVMEELEERIKQTGGYVEVGHLLTIMADPL